MRKIANVERRLFASPEYLARRGTPRTFDQLNEHNCIRLSSIPAGHRWLFRDKGKVKIVEIAGHVIVDNSDGALQLALAGAGIVRLGDIVVGNAARDGHLVPLLTDCHIVEPLPLSAVYPLGRKRLPKVRAFIDFVIERFKRAPWRQPLDRNR